MMNRMLIAATVVFTLLATGCTGGTAMNADEPGMNAMPTMSGDRMRKETGQPMAEKMSADPRGETTDEQSRMDKPMHENSM